MPTRADKTDRPTKMRCMAVQGNVYTGPLYCGYNATERDANGRPCCKRHLGEQLDIDWRGDGAKYPNGPHGYWGWAHNR